MEAIAAALNVPISSVEFGYYSQLCRPTPSASPSASPTSGLQVLSLSVETMADASSVESIQFKAAAAAPSFSIRGQNAGM